MNSSFQDAYIKRHKENIFLTMELSGMGYIDIIKMPIYRLDEYLNWKIRYDEEKEKLKSEGLDRLVK